MIKLNKKLIISIFTFLFIMSIASIAFAATHTITFNTEGGTPSTVEPLTIEDDENLVLPEVSKEGVDFGGWYYIDDTMPEGLNNKVSIDNPNLLGSYLPETVELHVNWIQPIDTVSININLPVGTTIESGSEELPLSEDDVTVPSGAKYAAFPEGAGIIKGYDDDSAYFGTIEKGKEYYVELWVSPNGGAFTSSTKITVNGTQNYKISDNYVDEDGNLIPEYTGYGFLLYAKVTAGATETSTTETSNPETGTTEASTTETSKESEETKTTEETTEKTAYKVLEGEKQTVNIAKKQELTFRFDIEYAKFLESGKVYMDNKLVDSSKYTTKEGSTIVTFNQDYTNSLSAGNHSLKVATADGEVTTSFTVTKTANPATGDAIMLYVFAFIVGIVGSIVCIKKIRK